MQVSRLWEMPSQWTFKMKSAAAIIEKYAGDGKGWADPFAGMYSTAEMRNDIEGDRNATHNMDALEFLKTLEPGTLKGILFDPPYSVEQCLRKYTPKFKGTAGRAEYWARCKDEIKRALPRDGRVISFCWDSTGCGKKRGFEIEEILLICHGACHNDTIVTVERKL